jgi:hypothetical protein
MIVNLLVLIMDFVGGAPLIYRMIFVAPSVGLTNIMACRVFRHTKLRRSNEGVHAVSTIMFRGGNTIPGFVDSQMGGTAAGFVPASEGRKLSSSIDDTDRSSSTYVTVASEKLPAVVTVV